MQITAEQVSKLRERTGAGMMDCKKALVENAGDFEKSIEYLRKKGIASASKKAGRTAKEGAVFALIDHESKAAVLVEVNCETDFVGKNENFQKFVSDVAKHIAKANPASPEELLTQKSALDSSKTMDEVVKGAIAVMGENIMVRRFVRFPIDAKTEAKSYIHMGGKVGVLVEFAIPNPEKKVQEAFLSMVRDVSMHIAAASPLYLHSHEVPADVVAKEKEISRTKQTC
jgi:elongation factor Ts